MQTKVVRLMKKCNKGEQRYQAGLGHAASYQVNRISDLVAYRKSLEPLVGRVALVYKLHILRPVEK